MADGAHDEATLDAYARAQARLEHAGGYRWRERRHERRSTASASRDADLDRDAAAPSPAAS